MISGQVVLRTNKCYTASFHMPLSVAEAVSSGWLAKRRAHPTLAHNKVLPSGNIGNASVIVQTGVIHHKQSRRGTTKFAVDAHHQVPE